MSTTLYRRQGDQFFDASGNVLAGGSLYYYRAGTTTPQATYSEQSGSTANPNPIPLNAAGRLTASVFLGSNYDYKELLVDAFGVTVAPWPVDNIPKAVVAAAAQTGFERLYLPWYQVTSASSPVTLLVANAGAGYEADATSGSIAFNLPSAASIQNGTGYYFRRIDATADNAVTVVQNGSELIDGVNASIGVPLGQNGVYLVSDGAQWLTYAFYNPIARLAGGMQSVTASASLTINMNLGWHVALTLGATVTSFSVTNPAPSGNLTKLVLEINNGGAYNISSWPSGTVWVNGTAPTITSGSGKKDTIILTSTNGGSSWRGYVVAQNMS
jgi:hypothetical protein